MPAWLDVQRRFSELIEILSNICAAMTITCSTRTSRVHASLILPPAAYAAIWSYPSGAEANQMIFPLVRVGEDLLCELLL